MDYRLSQLAEIGLVVAAVAAAAAILIALSVWIRRSYHVSRHAKTSRQRRRDATRIDLSKGQDAEAPAPQQRSRRSRRSRRGGDANHTIDLFGGRSEAVPEPPRDERPKKE